MGTFESDCTTSKNQKTNEINIYYKHETSTTADKLIMYNACKTGVWMRRDEDGDLTSKLQTIS